MSPTLGRSLVAEFLGTALLVFLAVGSAVGGIEAIGPLGVAFAFGLVLLALAYAIGPISGCHINPAVTLGVLLAKGMTATEAVYYWVVQLAGGIAGAALLKLMTSGFGDVTDQTGTLGSNDWGANISAGGAFVLEVLLTFVLVAVVLLVTGRSATPGFAGLAIGLTLTAVHLIGIPLDGTSVNPARSLGPALFAGGDPLAHVWLFLIAPLVGAVLAYGVVRGLSTPLVTEEAAREAEAAAPGGPLDQTGAQLPPEEHVVQIPPPARARVDHRRTSR
ncbi:aquaporin [Blastococcus sp. CT_GayMR16]|uniref:aquaporin n=1 Tax=Blastococcus sp. CT_GayMR16 TaxID=2559607 RepID=UPI00107318F5|nr:aquaporin [Blastococcus sp. CT_GayMR16]TFV89509.1 aquaporin [Blastococcus sp. CT_GayMR16]